MIKVFASIIWDISEKTGIPLGPAAPTIFGWMIGARPEKVNEGDV